MTEERRYQSRYRELTLYYPDPPELTDLKTAREPRKIKFFNYQYSTADPKEQKLIENSSDFRRGRILWANKPVDPKDLLAQKAALDQRLRELGIDVEAAEKSEAEATGDPPGALTAVGAPEAHRGPGRRPGSRKGGADE